MTDTQDYIRTTVPAPGPQFIPRLLRTDLSAVVTDGPPGEQFITGRIHSDLAMTSRIWEPTITLGAYSPTHPLSEAIGIGLSHA